ncbi:LEAF RUST 10 DISEASE-RESISTANCE LOCUS RECEPTOR-LIKE PROTEIN KINASE-like 2.1 [Helianthus annuus]|uniref:LEAF RUST 10 DISEASE-RESISTANCE LOCUS RECEPTOR-LIKE PROTEIN KINASE-like 2.1 n=1 Tax=Helianthus annuus TaxID=4232 RepID=UPI0016531088|nr:LEAF RUST 10 DISEASE-RESISTANCE LOCUS RECEPTOR-LIKE PROTEIN KINASE-like 2.1 [Helianthus annuus]
MVTYVYGFQLGFHFYHILTIVQSMTQITVMSWVYIEQGTHPNLTMKLVIGVGSVLLSIFIVIIFIIYFILKPPSRNCVSFLIKHKTEDDKNIEAFVKQYGSLSTQRYKYKDIKKMTGSFKVKLGQGGFGQVFKGKLCDGRLVAVKVLNSSKENGQEFINEVASIGRTSHVNIVTLLGFCFDNKKRALVYEYMPNGSLEKYIYSHVHAGTNEHIGVEKMYEIALGVACGLDYLHRGCNTRILHFDIKPHNILLDEDFCPKIADFGLAKLYSRKESIVSMFEARGTIGYIAPEVYNNNFGGVSHKTDVYSFGMLLLEMAVGGRKNVDAGVGSGRTSEIYFPDWIYNRLHKNEFLLDSVATREENDYARKMTIAGLWCIQPAPNQRPSINEVIEMLEGSMDTMEVPPKPFFSSPPRSPATIYSTSESMQEAI